MQNDQASPADLDPITFEVLRHRLWAINDEQGLVAIRMSGSPASYESRDFNSSLMTADGQALFIGVDVARLSASLDHVVRTVMERFGEDPGVRDGDMFITNDPWAGAVHMNDIAVVTPIFWDDQLVAWTGIVMHEMDVGGPVPGGFSVGAKDVFGEPPLIPPLKLMEGEKIRPDVEAMVLRNTRTRQSNALGVRARIGAQLQARQRLRDVIEQYGLDAFLAAQRGILRHAQESFARRMWALPDGVFTERLYLDHDGQENRFYPIALKMTKSGDHLTFDFTGTAPQAPGIVNCTYSGLEGGIYSSILPMLCFDMPWAVGALRDHVTIISKRGTINNAEEGAAVSSATVAACWMTSNVVNRALGRLLACSDEYKEEAQACSYPGYPGYTISGQKEPGKPLTAVLMDSGCGGLGARSTSDGVDSGGTLASPRIGIANVEVNERLYPILQVYRKHCEDSGGPGKYRGGVGIEYLNIAHKNPVPVEETVFGHGKSQPAAEGIFGGYPPSIHGHLMLNDTDILDQFASGRVPRSLSEISYGELVNLQAKTRSRLDGRSAHICNTAGGGGYGDPLERNPAWVVEDVRRRVCSAEVAREIYGVVLAADGHGFDAGATEVRRREIRAERLAQGQPVGPILNEATPPARDAGTAAQKLSLIATSLRITRDEQAHITCENCGHCFGKAAVDPKLGAAMRERAITAASPVNRFGWVDGIVLREYFCPGCATLFSVDVQLRDEPVRIDMELDC